MAKGVKVQVGGPTAFRALAQVWRNLDRRSLPPLGPMKTRPSLPGWANRSRCQRSSCAISLGNATRRRLACDLGSSSISRPSSASAVKGVPPAPLARRRRDLRLSEARPPHARPHPGVLIKIRHSHVGRMHCAPASLPIVQACGHRILGALPDIRAGHMNTGSSSGFGLRPQAPQAVSGLA